MKRILFVLAAILMMTAGVVRAQEKSASITVTGSATYDFGDVRSCKSRFHGDE